MPKLLPLSATPQGCSTHRYSFLLQASAQEAHQSPAVSSPLHISTPLGQCFLITGSIPEYLGFREREKGAQKSLYTYPPFPRFHWPDQNEEIKRSPAMAWKHRDPMGSRKEGLEKKLGRLGWPVCAFPSLAWPHSVDCARARPRPSKALAGEASAGSKAPKDTALQLRNLGLQGNGVRAGKHLKKTPQDVATCFLLPVPAGQKQVCRVWG